ncbi:SPOSA6832_03446 [Sporobolomyces salmonicolor]|uniref:Fimbrin n=1 Tax=Sporidiobolus salmonicolor TaxID=5005 RepID=A0A0D6EPL4_SPOSA|nr:SPOSA6832_03446 [Sporobolomyces salmonicolor]
MMQLVDQFNQIDLDSTGRLPKSTVLTALSSGATPNSPSGKYTYDQVRETLKTVSVDSSGQVELEDFVDLVDKLRSGAGASAGQVLRGGALSGLIGAAGGAGPAVQSHVTGGTGSTGGGKMLVKGSNSNITHSINEDERTEFTRHINQVLAGDPDIGDRLPIPTDTFQIFDECRDGLLLSKLINDSVPDTIDERVLNKASKARAPSAMPTAKRAATLNNFQMTENNNLVITSAKSLGLSTVNIGATDLNEGREHLILGLIWQIIRRGLLAKIDIKLHPELYRLLEDDETLEQFLRLPPDQILLRWFNYHLKAANWPRRYVVCPVSEWTAFLSRPRRWARGPGLFKSVMLSFRSCATQGQQLQQGRRRWRELHCPPQPAQAGPMLACTAARARSPAEGREGLSLLATISYSASQNCRHGSYIQVLQNADAIGCRKYLTPSSLVAGNAKLNLAFVANLFNTWPGLEPLEENERPVIEDFDAEGEREARVFTLWLNSLDVEPGVYDLFEDLKDGLVLLQAFDKVIPGSVVWRRVAKTPLPLSRFKAVENTNYCLDLATQNRMHIVGIQGADLVDGSRTLTLGLVWQMMRRNILSTMASLSKGGREIADSDIVKWANEQVKKGGKSSSMRSFKDPSIKDARFFLDLLDSLKPGYVDYSLVYDGRNDEERKANAKLAISIARKLGSLIFIVPEDIVEVRPRLVLTFCAALMALQTGGMH